MLAGIVGLFLVAVAAPLVQRVLGQRAGWLLAIAPGTLFALFAQRALGVAEGTPVVESRAWLPALDIALAFRLDGLALVFALLVTGIGTFVLIYASGYLGDHEKAGRFHATLIAFMASMLGLVLADDLLVLFVFWELTSITSYFLVGFKSGSSAARRAALQALLVTAGGGLALLAGLLLLGYVAGTNNIAALAAVQATVQGSSLYTGIVVLVLVGAFTKSAQFPFHFWLPDAMSAPTPASAYLHSATMVKAGIYLVARLTPVLGETVLWSLTLKLAGGATMVLGGYLALHQSDYKRVLAYSTISTLGMLTMLLGVGTLAAVEGVVLVLVAHALYKGALFMVAGAVEHETGTRDLDQLGGLRRVMPWTAAAAGIAALSLAGLGPLLSFIGKELVFEALLKAELARPFLLGGTLVTAMFLAAAAAIVGIRPFVGELRATPKEPHEPGVALLLGPVLLASAGLLFGLVPSLLDTYILPQATAAILGPGKPHTLALWHGLTPAFAMTALSLAGGALLYYDWVKVHNLRSMFRHLMLVGPARWYSAGLAGLRQVAYHTTRLVQNGDLRTYVLYVYATLLLVVGGALLVTVGVPRMPGGLAHVPLHGWAVAVLLAVGAIFVGRTRSRLAGVAVLGIVGYGAALVFVLFGAPDLAMTQFLFETLSVLLFVLLLPHMPGFVQRSTSTRRAFDAAVGVAIGVLMTLVVWAVTGVEHARHVSTFFAENSYVVAHGRNVVNVILVDFRALDTLGEITVLAVAGAGVYSLLRLRGTGGDGT